MLYAHQIIGDGRSVMAIMPKSVEIEPESQALMREMRYRKLITATAIVAKALRRAL